MFVLHILKHYTLFKDQEIHIALPRRLLSAVRELLLEDVILTFQRNGQHRRGPAMLLVSLVPSHLLCCIKGRIDLENMILKESFPQFLACSQNCEKRVLASSCLST
jgi:hypothetical protein